MDGDTENGDFGRGGLGREDVDLARDQRFFARQSSAFCLSVSIDALAFNLARAR